MEDRPIKLVVTITASPWKPEEGGESKVRIWDGTPLKEQNTAARIRRRRREPFKTFEWCIWGPFSEELVLKGNEISEELAMQAADKALEALAAAAAEGT